MVVSLALLAAAERSASIWVAMAETAALLALEEMHLEAMPEEEMLMLEFTMIPQLSLSPISSIRTILSRAALPPAELQLAVQAEKAAQAAMAAIQAAALMSLSPLAARLPSAQISAAMQAARVELQPQAEMVARDMLAVASAAMLRQWSQVLARLAWTIQ
jgi:hypothetical protein